MSEREFVVHVRGADEMLRDWRSPEGLSSFEEFVEKLAVMAAEQCEFDEGADTFCLYLRYMQMWAGRRGQDFRETFGTEARAKFLEAIGGKRAMERDVKSVHSWLVSIGWNERPVTADDLEQMVFSACQTNG